MTNPKVQVFFDTSEEMETMPVYAAVYGNNDVVKKWDSFEDWFVSEHNQLNTQYQNGEHYRIDIANGVLRQLQFEKLF